MKTTQSPDTHPDHQTVASACEFKSNGKAIAVGFAGQQFVAQSGRALFRDLTEDVVRECSFGNVRELVCAMKTCLAGRNLAPNRYI